MTSTFTPDMPIVWDSRGGILRDIWLRRYLPEDERVITVGSVLNIGGERVRVYARDAASRGYIICRETTRLRVVK